ncbi:uncharacterized protein LOC143030427 [Oratosquilla oratoria]|uniref:uncharacterized protein LOC143030427 n=2 Tax=Oratosquilla oratoria TaxID=337810 RepID=UPI003F759E66
MYIGNRKSHMSADTGEQPHEHTLCESFPEPGTVSSHVKIDARKKLHECTICKASFSRSDNLKRHVKTHTGEKPFQCTICQDSFSRSGTLKSHMRTHTGEKPHECTVCKTAFSRSDKLKSHMRTHTGEKPHVCGICKASFSWSDGLRSHMRAHSGERPHRCTICEASFSQSGALKTHIRTHTGERPYECKICHTSFSGSGNLTCHMRTHTGERPYRCTFCDASFSLSGTLKCHIRTHTGENPFKCSLCEASFSLSGNLKNHMRTHTGERPYQCSLCESSFSLSGNLKSHMKTHTRGKNSVSEKTKNMKGESPHRFIHCKTLCSIPDDPNNQIQWSSCTGVKSKHSLAAANIPKQHFLGYMLFTPHEVRAIENTPKDCPFILLGAGKPPSTSSLKKRRQSAELQKRNSSPLESQTELKLETLHALVAANLGLAVRHAKKCLARDIEGEGLPICGVSIGVSIIVSKHMAAIVYKWEEEDALPLDWTVSEVVLVKGIMSRNASFVSLVRFYLGLPVELARGMATRRGSPEEDLVATDEEERGLRIEERERLLRWKYSYLDALDLGHGHWRLPTASLSKVLPMTDENRVRVTGTGRGLADILSRTSGFRSLCPLLLGGTRRLLVWDRSRGASPPLYTWPPSSMMVLRVAGYVLAASTSADGVPSHFEIVEAISFLELGEPPRNGIEDLGFVFVFLILVLHILVWRHKALACMMAMLIGTLCLFWSWILGSIVPITSPSSPSPWILLGNITAANSETWGISLIVWGAIWSDGQPELVERQGNINSGKYVSIFKEGNIPVFSSDENGFADVVPVEESDSDFFNGEVRMNDVKEQRLSVKFCVKLGKTPTETFALLNMAYGDIAMKRVTCFRWHKHFKNDQQSNEDGMYPLVLQRAHGHQRYKTMLETSYRKEIEIIVNEENTVGNSGKTYQQENIGSLASTGSVKCEDASYPKTSYVNIIIEKDHTCRIYGTPLSSSSHWDTDMKTHDIENHWEAITFVSAFPQLPYLDVHTQAHVDDESQSFASHETSFSQSGCMKTDERPPSYTTYIPAFPHLPYVYIQARSHGDEAPHSFSHLSKEIYKCTFCEASFSQASKLKRHLTIHSEKDTHTCSFCGDSFSQSSELNSHLSTHFSKKTHKCSLCEASFSDSRTLTVHIRTHTGEKPFQCPLCESAFSQSGSLSAHIRRHTGEKPYKCDYCQTLFTESGNLRRHLRVHTGERPYRCSVCKASFTTSRSLKIHFRSHTGEKPYKCLLCEASFAVSGSLTIHMRTHTGERPYKCRVCEAAFSEQGNLKTHMRTHTGEKPNKCPLCKASFSHSGTLKDHMKVHTGEKPFHCSLCMASFTQSSNLKTHLKTHIVNDKNQNKCTL